MEKIEVKKSQLGYFKNINEALNIQQLTTMIQFGGSAIVDEYSFAKREMEAYEIMKTSLEEYNCDMKNTLEKFEKYKEVIQSIYLELGIQTGICLQQNYCQNVWKKQRRYSFYLNQVSTCKIIV